LKGRGLEAGIPHFNLDRLAANSMASQRLILWLGKTYGLLISERIYDLLNVYYFVHGHSLNDRPRLAGVVSSELRKMLPAPPTEEELLELLNGDSGRLEIEQALAALHHLGVQSIPKFIVEGKTVVDGAARSDEFIAIFREIEARGHAGTPVFHEILGISDEIIERGSHVPEHLAA
jgi:predicted DsbA family dithiol-disulfide isomerase